MLFRNNTVRNRHKNFNTPKETIFRLVTNATDLNPCKLCKITNGYDNEVYEVKTKEEESVILRINHFGEGNMYEEKWVADQYRRIGVPIHKVYSTGEFNTQNKELKEYMVLEKIKGLTLAELKQNLTKKELQQIYFEAGKILKKMHSIKVDGFYKRNKIGIWSFDNWLDYSNSNINDRINETEIFLQSGFQKKEIQKMFSYLNYYRDNYNCADPVLCHGDFLEEHIFLNDTLTIVGIIDFGLYRGDHPIYDFSRLYMDSRFKNWNDFKKGYGPNEMFDNNFNERLLLHTLSLQLGYLAYYSNFNMKQEKKYAISKLNKVLKSL